MIVAVFGALGRVGGKVCEIAHKRGHTVVPIDIRMQSENTQYENVWENTKKIDVAIDFSVPQATNDVVKFCMRHRCPLVTGVTGRNEEQQKLVEELSKNVTVVSKANFSQGVDALHRLALLASNLLADWDCEIVEIHRKNKLDSPSGTARDLAATVAQRKNFADVTVHSLRCGSNFGRHSVIFATQGESLTLTHQAENSEIFAKGAIAEAEKLHGFAQNVPDG